MPGKYTAAQRVAAFWRKMDRRGPAWRDLVAQAN